MKEAIERYFEKSFYKDHLSMYNRRPVYWLFDSGREKGFRVLVYMHRYSSSTLSVMREHYLGRVIEFYRKKLVQNEKPVSEDKGLAEKKRERKRRETLEKRLEECIVYDSALLEAIRKGITINPDEGVVNNYLKFQGVLASEQEKGKPMRVNLLAQKGLRCSVKNTRQRKDVKILIQLKKNMHFEKAIKDGHYMFLKCDKFSNSLILVLRNLISI